MTVPNEADYERLGRELAEYCKKYNIRVEDFFLILNDQKVIPMLRGKAAEYDAVYTLRQILSPQVWTVTKLNLNPQPGTDDQDIGITHRRTGIQIIIETKSAVRGSMRIGARSRRLTVPHFRVKCHRSRSNTNLPYNDRYLASTFDIIIATPTNALFEGGTVGEEFELISEAGLLEILYEHYKVADTLALIDACNHDWRFVLPTAIAEDVAGYKVIPRTPYVLLSGDPNWQSLHQIEPTLEAIVRAKARQQPRRS